MGGVPFVKFEAESPFIFSTDPLRPDPSLFPALDPTPITPDDPPPRPPPDLPPPEPPPPVPLFLDPPLLLVTDAGCELPESADLTLMSSGFSVPSFLDSRLLLLVTDADCELPESVDLTLMSSGFSMSLLLDSPLLLLVKGSGCEPLESADTILSSLVSVEMSAVGPLLLVNSVVGATLLSDSEARLVEFKDDESCFC